MSGSLMYHGCKESAAKEVLTLCAALPRPINTKVRRSL